MTDNAIHALPLDLKFCSTGADIFEVKACQGFQDKFRDFVLAINQMPLKSF